MNVTDPDQYREYATAAAVAVAQYRGKYIVRGGNPEKLEGDWQPTRIVILEFENADQIRRWYTSPEYQAAKALRAGAAQGRLVVVEGINSL
jgi:uncharacterized protein (DUF1330 family)